MVNGYANSAGNADTVDNEHANAFAHRAAGNNLVHSGNEITMIPDSYSGSLWLNYQSVGRNSSSNITEYIFGDGKGGSLAKISSGQFSGNSNSATNATNDSDGNAINSTYLKKSGGTMTGSITMSQGASARNVGIVGTYDYTKSAAIWAMGASYQIPAAGNSLGSLYGAAYVYQGQAGQGTMAGGHQFVWAQNGSANVALGTNIWTSGKFIKNGGTSS